MIPPYLADFDEPRAPVKGRWRKNLLRWVRELGRVLGHAIGLGGPGPQYRD